MKNVKMKNIKIGVLAILSGLRRQRLKQKCEKCRNIAQSASQKRDLDERILVAPDFLKIDEF